ncbi:unnamed protein product [Symbiodinium sp. CCMP2592]|nr:unnamed protein product [Symbiodinium sp. CCMP2592]
MPRSPPGSTTSDSYASSSEDWSDLDGNAISDEDMADSDASLGNDEPFGAHLPEAPQSDVDIRREADFELKRQSFVDLLARQLCRAHLEQELRSRLTARQAGAQLRDFWRRHSNDNSRDLQDSVVGFLDSNRRESLEHMVAALRCMLAEPMPDNDLAWLLSLEILHLPPLHRLQQAAQQAVFFSLCDKVGREAAAMVASRATDLAFNTFSIPALRLLWPLLDDDQRRKMQRWLFEYRMGTAEEPTEKSSSSSQKPRYG